MLARAQDGGYAVGHFNISNLEFAQAAIDAAKELSAPVILATSVSALEHAGIEPLFQIVKALAGKVSVPVALHLDHGPSIAWAKTCISNRWTSVMIDSSKYDFEKNVSMTRQVVKSAHRKKVCVEAELGRLKGIEDIVVVKDREAVLTDPMEARAFVEKTGCDSLAVAIGESHGAFKFKGKPHLDLKRLAEIREEVLIPLVLHGSSSVYPELVSMADRYGGRLKGVRGVPDVMLKKCISRGICKVNTDTDLRIAFIAGIRRYLAMDPASIDYRAMLGAGREAVFDVVNKKIQVFGSDSKA